MNGCKCYYSKNIIQSHYFQVAVLTHWLPVYEDIVLGNRGKTESCSNPQKTLEVFEPAMKKNSLVLGFVFFVSDVISNVGFWPFLADGDGTVTDCTYVAEKIFFSLPDPAPTARQKYFTEVFIGN